MTRFRIFSIVVRTLALGLCGTGLAQTPPAPTDKSATPPSAVRPRSVSAQREVDTDPLVPLSSAVVPARSTDKPAGGISITGLHSANEFVINPYKVRGTYPPGWSTLRVGNMSPAETTMYFAVPGHAEASPNLYYRPFAEKWKLSDPEIVQWLKEAAATKEKQRIEEGFKGYTNREAKLRVIRDRPALTWVADFRWEGQRWVEYMTRIYSPAGTTLLFMKAPAKDMPTLIPQFETLIQSVLVP